MKTAKQPTALIIDDEPLFLKAMEAVLKKFGIHPITAADTTEFLDKATSLKPTIYLVDLHLGELGSGLDLIRAVRQMHGYAAPIIVISRYTDVGSITSALEIGANDYIPKPLNKDFLASKLARYVDSDAIREHQATFHDLPDGRIPAKLTVEFEITEIDERGVKLQGKHMLSKGAVFRIDGSLLSEVFEKEISPLVTVSSSWMVTGTENTDGLYGAYAEFDPHDTDLTRALRKWLANRVVRVVA